MEQLSPRQKESVDGLIYTSVDDARGSLRCNRYSEPVLRECLRIATRMGEKTRAKLFASALRRLEKTRQKKDQGGEQ